MFEKFYTIFYLGPIPIQVWGFFVALGMALSFIILWHRAKKLGQNTELILDLGVWMVAIGIIGGRLFHVVFYEPTYFIQNPLDIVKIWQGGMSSFGGFFGAIIALIYFVKRKKINLSDLINILDIVAYAALYGWMLGRVGCVMTHYHLGKLTRINFFSVQTIDGLRLEMAFLEIILLLPLALIFYITHNKKMRNFYYASTLFIYYGFLRFILDFFRAKDILHADARYLGLTPAQYFAILLVFVGVIMKKKMVRWPSGLRRALGKRVE